MGESVASNLSKPYSIENLIKSMANDDEFSDVTFVVIEENSLLKKIIRANKYILRLG